MWWEQIHGWEGSVPEVPGAEISAAAIVVQRIAVYSFGSDVAIAANWSAITFCLISGKR